MLATTSRATTDNVQTPSCKVDGVLDYIPVISTFTNLFHLFEKAVLACIPAETQLNGYYTHIQSKSALKCALLLIPFIGNIIAYFAYNKLTQNSQQASPPQPLQN